MASLRGKDGPDTIEFSAVLALVTGMFGDATLLHPKRLTQPPSCRIQSPRLPSRSKPTGERAEDLALYKFAEALSRVFGRRSTAVLGTTATRTCPSGYPPGQREGASDRKTTARGVAVGRAKCRAHRL